MARGEFELIERYFGDIGLPAEDLSLGPGDDAAVVSVPPGRELVLSLDTLVDGVHFSPDADPADVAYKALAVNLSDLAAMAAEPAWFLLSLTLPAIDTDWLDAFAASLKKTAADLDADRQRATTGIAANQRQAESIGSFFEADGKCVEPVGVDCRQRERE